MNYLSSETFGAGDLNSIGYLYRLVDFKNRIELIPACTENNEKFIATMTELWAFLTSIEDDDVIIELQGDKRFPLVQQYLAKKWHEYISIIETDEAERFLSKTDSKEANSMLAEEDYMGVNYELSLLSEKLTGLSVIMVGCGPFPETLMEVYKDNKDIKYAIGIEGRNDVSQLANRIVTKVFPGVENVKAVASDAESFDYRDADVIFLANGLIKKDLILQRIYDTAKDGVKILARNPILMGRLFYEDLYSLPSIQYFVICGSVRASKLSETILFRKRDKII
ncbi:hypothetical protein KGM48_00720 [Patescibacteria group bacterium]|nr:hypothetical protein [Patescibacteria group bacterium]